jgi:UrcA family protein
MQPQPTTLPENAMTTRRTMDNAVRLPPQPPARRLRHDSVLVGLALTLSALPMAAAAQVPATHQTVTYADLDLSRPAGRQELSERIRRAARQVCGAVRYGTGIDRVARYHACVSDAARDAEARARPTAALPAFAVQVRPQAQSRF